MDYLWSPWRYRYLTGESKPHGLPSGGCIFCNMARSGEDEYHLIVHRGAHNFVVLNRFPYTSGHLMVVPYAHASELGAIDEVTSQELMTLTRATDRHIRAVYKPDGVNLGMNMGESAGAGIAGHIHMHVLPRWYGDSNFMTTIGETRVLPEDLKTTWNRVHSAFEAAL